MAFLSSKLYLRNIDKAYSWSSLGQRLHCFLPFLYFLQHFFLQSLQSIVGIRGAGSKCNSNGLMFVLFNSQSKNNRHKIILN